MFLGSYLCWAYFIYGGAAYTPRPGTESITFDRSCSRTQQDNILYAYDIAVGMAGIVLSYSAERTHNTSFEEFFGPSAIANQSAVHAVFEKINTANWTIAASCDVDDSNDLCTDPYLQGPIGAAKKEARLVNNQFNQI